MPLSLFIEAIDAVIGHYGRAAEVSSKPFLPNNLTVGWIHRR
jgi:hypothetical protein